MSATFIQNGEFLDYVPTVDVPQGAIVVIGNLVGIAHRAIPAGTLGSIALTGVYELPIPAGSVAGAGDPVFYEPALSQLVLGGGAPPGGDPGGMPGGGGPQALPGPGGGVVVP